MSTLCDDADAVLHISWHPMTSVWMVDMVPIVWVKSLRLQTANYDYGSIKMVRGGIGWPVFCSNPGCLRRLLALSAAMRQTGRAMFSGSFGSLCYSKGI